MSRMCIVPPYVLSALLANLNPDTTEDDREIAEWVRRTLSGRLDKGTLATTISRPGVSSTAPPSISEAVDRTISTADDTDTLPGGRVRGEGDPESSDPAVDEAYTGLGATWQLYHDAFARNSIDGKGLPLLATVHYEHSYDNAFFDGTQMVFGDGDGRYFNRFTKPLDVVGHELSHGVVAATADLVYQGQSGALNESMADCFGSMVKQYDLGQTAEEADWIIGAGLFTAAVNGVGLRSMKAPGTAFDDPALGKDPQPASMADYVETTDDDGGVHLNSGIPNRAFYLASVGIGGNTWDGAGKVWYVALTGGKVSSSAQFADFAGVTADTAAEIFGAASSQHTAVVDAWTTVGLPPTPAV
ncbi:MAG TPA: M4 family metallopeptidase [Actinopolymorphaceae bacterium]|jgi:Zn-dependent metalloprotease